MAAETGKKTTTKKKTTTQTKKSSANKSSSNTANNRKAPVRKVRERTEQDKMISSELSLLILLAVSIFLFLCNFNILGPVGNAVSGVLFGLFGLPAYVTPLFIFIAAGFIVSNKDNIRAMIKIICSIIVFFIICIFIHLIQGSLGGESFSLSLLYETGQMKKGGGVLFGSLAFLLYSLLDKLGSIMLLMIGLIACFVVITEKSFFRGLQRGGEYMVSSAKEDAVYRREQAVIRRQEREASQKRKREAAKALEERRRDEAKAREREEALRQEIKETEKILRMDKKISGVMLDTNLKRTPSKPIITHRENVHEITAHDFDEAAHIREQSVEPQYIKTQYIKNRSEEDYITLSKEEDYPYTSLSSGSMHEIILNPGAEEDILPETSGETVDFFDTWNHTPQEIQSEALSFNEGYDITEDDIKEDTIKNDIYDLTTADIHPVVMDIPAMKEDSYDMTEDIPAIDGDIYAIKEDIPFVDDDIYAMDEEAYGERFQEISPESVSSVTPKAQEKPVAKFRTVSEKDRMLTEAGHVEQIRKPIEEKPYMFPPISCLIKPETGQNGNGKSMLQETAQKLQNTLKTFGVNVTIANISQGPTVTRYELQPQLGVKVSKIVSLTDDIKLNLAATDIRIEAPIPGKSVIGIEVPNKENSVVRFRELVESKEFKEFPSTLAFAVGKDIGGNTVVADISKMPHMLIAGSTGSGKSVCINTLIISLLYKARPDEVKLIMIDPKVVELSVYNKIPHLLIPVVTEPKKAAAALHWGVAEMNDRYQKFADFNVRDLNGYNKEIEKRIARGEENVPEKLPKVVIIVDELADLMMVAPGEVEDSICRLAQLARAAGIHLIIATQRPSVDVITGLIKANMPSRVAFAVSSGVDSRTILDMNGAEKLLGKGDMLFYPQGYPKPVRVQGALVTDEEVSNIVDFLRNQSLGNVYNEDIEDKIKNFGVSSAASSGGEGGSQRDEHFIEAGKFIIDKDKASIGMLQRVFRIGYNRAARIMDQLAEAGVVGEEEGTKPRKVLMSIEQFEAFIDEVY